MFFFYLLRTTQVLNGVVYLLASSNPNCWYTFFISNLNPYQVINKRYRVFDSLDCTVSFPHIYAKTHSTFFWGTTTMGLIHGLEPSTFSIMFILSSLSCSLSTSLWIWKETRRWICATGVTDFSMWRVPFLMQPIATSNNHGNWSGMSVGKNRSGLVIKLSYCSSGWRSHSCVIHKKLPRLFLICGWFVFEKVHEWKEDHLS